MGAVNSTVVGASVGAVLGAVFVAVLVTCIVYMNKRLLKKTNKRAKWITSTGAVNNEQWVIDDTKANLHDKRITFGHIDKTEHVEVKEQRRIEEGLLPPQPQKAYFPSPAPPIRPVARPIIYPDLPRIQTPPRTPPKLRRYKMRSWPKKERRSPVFEQPNSIGPAGGVNYFIYGVPFPVPSLPVYPAPPPPPQQQIVAPAQETLPIPIAPPRRHRNKIPDWIPRLRDEGFDAISHFPAVPPPQVITAEEVVMMDVPSEYSMAYDPPQDDYTTTRIKEIYYQ